MKCRSDKIKLQLYYDDELCRKDKKQLSLHIRNCADCQKILKEFHDFSFINELYDYLMYVDFM